MRTVPAFVLLAIIWLSLFERAQVATAVESQPNIVLVMCDDLGWGDVGFNGNTVIKTPQLDAMAASGMKFTRFYAAAPVCSPTRGSCVTGRHPFRYGIFFANTGHMLPRELTLAEMLQDMGYATGHFGKWHLGTLSKTQKDANRGGPDGVEHFSPPQENGFDVCFSTESKVPTYDPLIKPPSARGTWWDPVTNAAEQRSYGTAYWDHHGRSVAENMRGDNSRVIMDRAVPFIRGAVGDKKPFFAVVWFHTPHLPVVAGPEHTAMYAEHDKYAQHYFGCITAMDEQVGRLRAELRNLGVAENTLITFCSDNGPESKARTPGQSQEQREKSGPGSAGPFRGRKRDLYEGGIRVPAIVEWPKRVPGGSTTDFPAVTSDYLPTILEIVGAEMPDGRPLDGVSLVPVFEGRMDQRPKPIGFQSRGRVALSDNRYKLIKYPKGDREGNGGSLKTGTGTYQLFDLVADPAETTDLAAQHPEIVAKMRGTLEAWQASCEKSLAGED